MSDEINFRRWVFLISNSYWNFSVTNNDKGHYSWPQTIAGHKVDLPCEIGRVNGADPSQLRSATHHCSLNGSWIELNTDNCPYVSHVTRILQQFSKVILLLLITTKKSIWKPFSGHFLRSRVRNWAPKGPTGEREVAFRCFTCDERGYLMGKKWFLIIWRKFGQQKRLEWRLKIVFRCVTQDKGTLGGKKYDFLLFVENLQKGL